MDEILHTIDSAFVGGVIPDVNAPVFPQIQVFGSSLLLSVMLVISAVLILCFLPSIVEIIPCQLGAFLRSKELVNLENSAVLARSRSVVSLVMVIPFLTLAAGYRLYEPAFLSGVPVNAYYLAVTGVFLTFVLLHEGIALLVRPASLDGRVRKAVRKSAWTFFVSITEAGFLVSGLLALFNVVPSAIKSVIIVLFSVLYVNYSVRKFQVLRQGCTIFQTFLYLCALEILPTGLLVLSALVL